MADIERWITVNGVHIPIMKGESKARAAGNFIRNRRKQKLDEEYYKKRAEGKSWKEANEAIRQKIKGYRTKLKDADDAYKKEWERLTPNVKKAQEDLDTAKRSSFYDTPFSKAIDRDYENSKKSKEDRADAIIRTREWERSAKLLENSLRHQLDMAEDSRELYANQAYRNTLSRIPNAYKLKGQNGNYVNKSTVAAMKKDIKNRSDYALGELIYGIEKTADDRGYRTSGNRKRGLTEYEKKYQDLARAEMRLRRRKNK